MVQVCVGNSKLEQHCSKESTEQDQKIVLEAVRGEYTADYCMDGKTEKEKKTGNRNYFTDTIYSSRHVLVIFYFGSLFLLIVLKVFVNQSFLSPDASLLKKKKGFCKMSRLLSIYTTSFSNVSTIYTTVATELNIY